MVSMGLLDREQAVLVVIDVQEKMLRAIHDKEELLEKVEKVVRFAKIFGIPVIFTEQYAKGLGPTVQSLIDLAEEWHPIDKGVWFSACQSAEFMDALEATGRKQVALCGIEAHVCVNQTAHEALANGYSVYLLADCVGSRSKKDERNGLRSMARAGAEIANMERFLFEAARKAGSPEFKAAQQLIK